MNSYQKAATLAVRIVGSIVALMGAIGPIYLTAMSALGQDAPTYPSSRLVGSAFWFAGGVLVVVFSKAIGRRLGQGLE